LLLIDMDGFKKVNDTYGHLAGDELLQGFSQRLKAAMSEEDLTVRMGGDEFAVLVRSSYWRHRLDALCLRLIELACEPFKIVGVHSFVRASIGALVISPNEVSSSEVVRKADMALYEAKNRGKGRHFFYTPEFDSSLSLRRTIEAGLARSLDGGTGLSCAYQPVISARDGGIIGVEALARWIHPEHGSMPPLQFIPVAEETGLIGRLGEWILRRACQEARDWSIDVLSVNISPLQLRDARFAEGVLTILKQENFPASRLELEITEAAVMHADEVSLEQFRKLRAAGISIALDDFGTGYSSLRLLQELKLDKIKIDRSFVQFATEASGSAAIVEGLARLGATLGIEVVAEGVEQQAQREFLIEAGCTGLQGFLFCVPIEAVAISVLLQAQFPV
jgi:diguanylate cyclase (GGDEF)-like protein